MRRRFACNEYNYHRGWLANIDQTKGRGVLAGADILKNTIVCLFPGEQTYRFPPTSSLPREKWPMRSADKRWLDREEDLLPISDYAIRVSVLDFTEGRQEVGYHWRILEPMATDPRYKALAERVQYAALDDRPMPLPASWLADVSRQVDALYAKLRSMKTVPNVTTATSDDYRFYFTKGQWDPGLHIVMHLGGTEHFVCAMKDVKNEAYVKYNLHLAINTQFDASKHRRRDVTQYLQDVKDLRLDDRYPHMGAFVNRPYDDEHANLRFADPHEWISMVYDGKLHASADLKRLVQHDMLNKDLLQRQALISREFIPAYTELLVDYNRE